VITSGPRPGQCQTSRLGRITLVSVVGQFQQILRRLEIERRRYLRRKCTHGLAGWIRHSGGGVSLRRPCLAPGGGHTFRATARRFQNHHDCPGGKCAKNPFANLCSAVGGGSENLNKEVHILAPGDARKTLVIDHVPERDQEQSTISEPYQNGRSPANARTV
jgi:hypothetical protein